MSKIVRTGKTTEASSGFFWMAVLVSSMSAAVFVMGTTVFVTFFVCK